MLSVILIVKNEAENIAECLQSVRWADEIVVLDSGSTDGTVEIAKQFTDKVFSTDWPGYGLQKQRALNYASGDWILNLDGDEVVTEALRKDLQKVMQENLADAYRIPIFLKFYGRLMKHSSSPKGRIRFFKREGAYYTDNIVHEEIKLPQNARIGQLKSGLNHISYRDISDALEKLNQYSSLTAKMRLQQNKKTSFSKVILHTFWMFFQTYFIQKGFLEGREGFILAVMRAEHSFYRGLKMIFQDKNVRSVG